MQTADGSYTLQSSAQTETYHSTFGAVAESREVFIKNSGVLQRLQQRQPTHVLEIGFGSGLNFMLTAGLAQQYNTALTYQAIEYNLPPVSLTCRLLRLNAPQQGEMITHLEKYLRSNEYSSPLYLPQKVSLTLRVENALQTTLPGSTFDAIYLDAFSSKNNPNLWTREYLGALNKALAHGGILATYSVNRAFKDALTEAGFHWKKIKGPAGKREVITAWRQ